MLSTASRARPLDAGRRGTKHPTAFWANELVLPHRAFTIAGFDVTIATSEGVQRRRQGRGSAAR